MDIHPLYGEGPQHLLWGGSLAALKRLTVSGTPSQLNCCVIFTGYTSFTNVTVVWRPIT